MIRPGEGKTRRRAPTAVPADAGAGSQPAATVAAPAAAAAEPAAAEVPGTAACAAAKEQLADATGVTIEGMPQSEYNAVYLPAGEHEGWLRFESAEGKHLYRLVDLQVWWIRDTFDPAAKGAKGHVSAADGLLPVGQRQWQVALVAGGGYTDLPLTVSLLAVGAEEVKEAERRLAEREVE